MANERLPGVVATEVPDSGPVVGYLQQIGGYLRRLTSTIFGGASQITMGAAQYARDFKSVVDPVIQEVGNTAKLAQDVSLIGVLADRKGVTGIRKVYDNATSIVNRSYDYETRKSPDIDKQLATIVLTPEEIRDRIKKAPLPPKKKKKGKPKPTKSESKYGAPVYKGKIRISRRRK
jgi:hypothetical protein